MRGVGRPHDADHLRCAPADAAEKEEEKKEEEKEESDDDMGFGLFD
jgi:ribosomal protein L12E/L44/L45/RPP1/RPP2